jgi:2-polyprenyl-3-methyl-5-hydroxy-6-metoxy-1,4-benzoquinol methylase
MKYLYSPYNKACPVCANPQNKLLYKVTSTEAARHFVVTHGLGEEKLATVDEKISKLWRSPEASVVACSNCGFTFADPFVAGDHEFYNLLPHTTEGGAEYWKWEFDKTFKKIAAIATGNNNLTLLEIGASGGDFIKRTVAIIPKKNILCLEYSESGVNSIRNAGIEAHSWHFHELAGKAEFEKQFDIICLFQVLEHLDQLEETFNTLKKVIKPGGHIFIGVPNGRKIEFNELNDALLDMPPNHIGRFNKKTFALLADKYGLQIDEIAIEPFTSLDVMKTVMFYQSLKRAQFPPVTETAVFRIKRYLSIKYMRLQAIFLHKQLGDALWVHYLNPL